MTGPELLIGDRQHTESDAAVFMCNEYLRLGPLRTLQKLFVAYNDQPGYAPVGLGTLSTWSSTWDWKGRATEYDAVTDRARADLVREAAERIMAEGIALTHERVRKLGLIEEKLFEDFMTNGMWIEENRQMAGELVVNRVFNRGLVQTILDIYEDAAQETGGRRMKVDQTVASAVITAEELQAAQNAVVLQLQSKFAGDANAYEGSVVGAEGAAAPPPPNGE